MEDIAVNFEPMSRLSMVHAQTPKGQEWLDENVITSETLTFNGAVAVENRYVEDLIRGMLNDDLEVSVNGDRVEIGADGESIVLPLWC